MVLGTVLSQCKIPSYEPDCITTFIMSPISNRNYLPICEGKYRNGKAKIRKSYRKSVSLSLIGHGKYSQTMNSLLMGITEHRKQPDNQDAYKVKKTKMKIMVGCGFETFGTQI